MEKLAPEQADTDKDGSGAAGQRQQLNDITLDFGAGASPSACSALLWKLPNWRTSTSSTTCSGRTRTRFAPPTRAEPGAWNADNATEANVDALLAISDYYQVAFLKTTCEMCSGVCWRFIQSAGLLHGVYTLRLLSLPVTSGRLLQAHKRGLTRRCERCSASQARDCTPEDLVDLSQTSPDIMLDLAMRMRETQQLR
eukprot:s21_g18.t1